MTEDEKRETLIGLIREGAKGHTFMPTERIADHLLANGVTLKGECEACGKAASDTIVGLQETIKELRDAQRLIPVTERLPEQDGRYLCIVKSYAFPGKTYQAIRMYDKFGFREGNIYTDDVTHWMPLPKPPKEE